MGGCPVPDERPKLSEPDRQELASLLEVTAENAAFAALLYLDPEALDRYIGSIEKDLAQVRRIIRRSTATVEPRPPIEVALRGPSGPSRAMSENLVAAGGTLAPRTRP